MRLISIIIGIVFGFLAALTAFVITWKEYERHYFSRKRLFNEALQPAIFAFLIFFLLSILVVFIVQRFVIKS